MRRLFILLLLAGCGSGGGDEASSANQSQSETNTCGDSHVEIVFDVPEPEVNEIIEGVLDEGGEAVVEETGLNQEGTLKLFKVTIVSGCNNTVVNDDDVTTSDDDTTINLSPSEAL